MRHAALMGGWQKGVWCICTCLSLAFVGCASGAHQEAGAEGDGLAGQSGAAVRDGEGGSSPTSLAPSDVSFDASLDPGMAPPPGDVTGSTGSGGSGARDAGADEGTPSPAAGPDELDASPEEPGESRPLVFSAPYLFELPINSLRYGASGHDPESGLCFTAVWYAGANETWRACGADATPGPYVVIESAEGPGCWSYGPTATETLEVDGCFEVSRSGSQRRFSVDVDIDVKSDLWSGTLRFVTP